MPTNHLSKPAHLPTGHITLTAIRSLCLQRRMIAVYWLRRRCGNYRPGYVYQKSGVMLNDLVTTADRSLEIDAMLHYRFKIIDWKMQ